MLILNEEKYAKDVLMGQRDDVKSFKKKIELITRYNYHVLHKNDDDNYNSTVKWMEKHHNIFSEHSYANVIIDYIKRAPKHPFYNVGSIKITKNEMDVISSQHNLRHEKILFVLLCMAKAQRAINGYDNGIVAYSLPDLFKSARVSVPVDEREKILHKFLVDGLIGLPFKNDTKCLFVKFIDEAEDNVVLELDERDCGELAYTYLLFSGQGKIVRCTKCGKLIKKSLKFGNICKDCEEDIGDTRVKWCIDCGKELELSFLNTKTCRCDNCQKEYRKQYMRDLMKEKRAKYASVSTASET